MLLLGLKGVAEWQKKISSLIFVKGTMSLYVEYFLFFFFAMHQIILNQGKPQKNKNGHYGFVRVTNNRLETFRLNFSRYAILDIAPLILSRYDL